MSDVFLIGSDLSVLIIVIVNADKKMYTFSKIQEAKLSIG